MDNLLPRLGTHQAVQFYQLFFPPCMHTCSFFVTRDLHMVGQSIVSTDCQMPTDVIVAIARPCEVQSTVKIKRGICLAA